MTDSLSIAHIVPGSGGTFYCQNCIRDLALVPALRDLGHDAYILPLYLPLQDELPDAFKDASVFFGAVNLYLSETLPVFKRLPRPLSKLLDSPSVLKVAARKSGTTRAEGLEDMTISMLRGESGNQKESLDELITWISQQERLPDVIHISNALLIGLAPPLKQAFAVPIVCSLQDEFGWVETMRPDYIEEVWSLMAASVESVDAFCSVSQYYGDLMRGRLAIPDSKLHVIHVGVPLTHFHPCESQENRSPTIGFLSKLSPQYGLDLLINAFIQLKSEAGFKELKLKATGGMTEDVREFLGSTEKKLLRLGLWKDVEFIPEFGEAKRGEFLRSLDVLSVPVPDGEAFGTYQVEAMACGVPVVQPRAGAFTEVVEQTGGGLLYDPNDENALADSLRSLLTDPERAKLLGHTGFESVKDRFSVQHMASKLTSLYTSLLERTDD